VLLSREGWNSTWNEIVLEDRVAAC
jgi:hypothetical protein